MFVVFDFFRKILLGFLYHILYEFDMHTTLSMHFFALWFFMLVGINFMACSTWDSWYIIGFVPFVGMLVYHELFNASICLIHMSEKTTEPILEDILSYVSRRDYKRKIVAMFKIPHIFEGLEHDLSKNRVQANKIPMVSLSLNSNPRIKYYSVLEVIVRLALYHWYMKMTSIKVWIHCFTYGVVVYVYHVYIFWYFIVIAVFTDVFPQDGMVIVACNALVMVYVGAMTYAELLKNQLFRLRNFMYMCTFIASASAFFYNTKRDFAAENVFTKSYYEAHCTNNQTIRFYLAQGCQATAYSRHLQIMVTGNPDIYIKHIQHHSGVSVLNGTQYSHLGDSDNIYDSDCNMTVLNLIRNQDVHACMKIWNNLPEMSINLLDLLSEFKSDFVHFTNSFGTIESKSWETRFKLAHKEVSLLLSEYTKYWPVFPPIWVYGQGMYYLWNCYYSGISAYFCMIGISWAIHRWFM